MPSYVPERGDVVWIEFNPLTDFNQPMIAVSEKEQTAGKERDRQIEFIGGGTDMRE